MKIKRLHPGSSGHGGHAALKQIINDLRQGYSTVVAADGPYGPLHQVKKGVLLMSMQTGLPIIPVRFKCSHFCQTPEWDKKKVPWPFAKIIVEAGAPVFIYRQNLSEGVTHITNWLNRNGGDANQI